MSRRIRMSSVYINIVLFAGKASKIWCGKPQVWKRVYVYLYRCSLGLSHVTVIMMMAFHIKADWAFYCTVLILRNDVCSSRCWMRLSFWGKFEIYIFRLNNPFMNLHCSMYIIEWSASIPRNMNFWWLPSDYLDIQGWYIYKSL